MLALFRLIVRHVVTKCYHFQHYLLYFDSSLNYVSQVLNRNHCFRE